MSCIANFISSMVDPTSRIYGSVTIVASIGTIIALYVTIKSVNESRDQFKLLMKRNALDNLNNTLDDILERIVYMKDAANVEVYFGRPAIYRATHGEPTRIFEGVKNVGHFEEYVQQLEHVIKEAKDILKGVSNIEINNEYMNKLKAEVGFSSDYIRPLIEVMKDRFGDTYRELATRLLQQLADIHQKF